MFNNQLLCWSQKYLWLLLGTLPFHSYAQLPNVEAAKTLYPDAPTVYLARTQEYRLFMEDNKVLAICTVHDQQYINKEGALSSQSSTISTDNFIEASNIKAYTLIPKSKKYEKKEVENIELKDDPGRNSFYDARKSYNFVFPSVQPGAVLDLSYQLRYNEVRFMGRYFWMDYTPCLHNELVIIVPKNIHITYKEFHCEKQNIVFSKEEKKGETVYRWTLDNGKEGKYYDDAPNFRYFEPHFIFYVTDYTVGGVETKLLGTPKDLYSWYYDIQKNLNKTEDTKLKAITDSLVTGVASEIEKVKRIFYWVQDNVSYVAFEDGMGGFVPRDAALVCSRKFGDCKDMASIIHEMLRMAKVPSYLTWIGTRDIPYKYSEVPTPLVDNHMITSYRDPQGQWYFLDATGKLAQLELHTSFIQGKQALLSVSKDSFLLVSVPVKDTSDNMEIDSVSVVIQNNVVNGTGQAKLSGYERLNYLYYIESQNKQERLDFFKDFFSKGNNKVNFTDIEDIKIDRDSPFSVNYKFTIPDYLRKTTNEIYLNLNMNNGWGVELIDTARKVPLNFKHKTTKRLIVDFTIPEGYKVEYMPPSYTNENKIVGFRSTYVQVGNKVTLCTNLYINTLILDVADFDKYNKVIADYIKSRKQTLSLIKQ